MKLLRFGLPGAERPGLLDSRNVIRDLSSHIDDIIPQTVNEATLHRLTSIDPATLPEVPGPVRYGPPVGGVGKIVCVGLNYRLHADEASMVVPKEPLLFMKATTAICGPNDPIVLPKDSVKGDWEVELGVVIGRIAQDISHDEAMEHVAGFCVANDVSERALQLEREGQWIKGKSSDTFAPLGPWLVTQDEIPDVQQLELWSEVNGRRYQHGNTRDMLFSVAFIVSYVSSFMTLLPGDVILTGTPPGVGMGQRPPVFLRPGDCVRVGVQALGEQRQEVRAYTQTRRPDLRTVEQ
jgi:2,4-diketo-3-deoxy-L-fuconate hydrolase